jgi:electron transfer flavoprotein alpha/beta subunit
MANVLYTQMINVLVKSAGVPEDQAVLNVGRLLKMNNIDENSVESAHCAKFYANLEGIVLLRGDKSKLNAVKPLLAALTK